VLDLRLRVSMTGRWQSTGAGLCVSADHLPELLDVIERAIGRLPDAR
jgi:hypothetical protein